MTRESKIGLLVGLTFIIMLGILVSDYMASSTEPPAAPLQQAGNVLRSALGQPPADSNNQPIVTVPPTITPRETVVTREELNARAAVRAAAPQPQPVAQNAQQIDLANAFGNSSQSQTVQQHNPAIPPSLDEIAKAKGEELVAIDKHDTKSESKQTIKDDNSDKPVQVATATRTYKALPGDSLGKIASKMYNTAGKPARDAIVAANPSLADDPSRIIAGRTYVIPPLKAATPVVVLNTKTDDDNSTKETPVKLTNKPATTPGYIYTVKSGDTLWSIAKNELNNPATVSAIKELNTDVLKGSDRVRVNMKLRLPAKPVAMAN